MSLEIKTPVQFIKGVGPKLGDVLHKRGVETVGDLLEWYPRAYEDRRRARSVSTLEIDQVVSLRAQVLKVRSMTLGKSYRKMYEVIIGDQTGRIACKFFRVPYKGYFERFEPHQLVRVTGKVTEYRGRREFHHPDIQPINPEEESVDQVIPLYTETEGLNPAKLRKIIQFALENVEVLEDPLPKATMEKYQLITRQEALSKIHLPEANAADALAEFRTPAQKRLIFEEFFWLELILAARKAGVEKEQGVAIKNSGALAEKLRLSLEFELTGAQLRSFDDIRKDLAKPHPMHRLVQGDVGSGKTLVALMAATYAAESKFQSAIMVPTEILAEQHLRNAKKRLEPLGLKVDWLTGSHKKSEKEDVLRRLAAGEIDLIVGTHALIEDPVQFKNLGLVVIDEQHRFGVGQRQALKQKGVSPHFLVMTATPIPRTLAMTVYGDLDVSIINELPKGRQSIITRKTFQSKRPQVMGFMREQLKAGRQAYIVYPLVEESEKIDLKNAIEEYEKIKQEFPDYTVGLLHGRMKPQEKDEVMREFRDGKTKILVSTTVIEVGVDVPNANFMMIEHAERFGLSQLHQLRGRVGRGAYKSYCVLMLGHAVSDESMQRSQIMESTNDGFKISEADLELRGPGEFLGTRQSGLPGFKLANLVRDIEILQQAREAAFSLLKGDPDLKKQEHAAAKEFLDKGQAKVVG